MKTTLYNHKQIGNNDLPIIPNVEFKKLVEGIKNKTITSLEYHNKTYSMTKFQIELATQLIKENERTI